MNGAYYLSYFLVIVSLILASFASANVNNQFKKYSTVLSQRGITGRMAAEQVLRNAGVYDISIEPVQGSLTDHYDPRENVIRLSDNVFDSSSIAAIGIAAHEAGHAIQYASGYGPIKLRNAIIPITNIGATLSWPLIIIGMLSSSLNMLTMVGALLFLVVVFFQMVTLPVEFDASYRGMNSIAALQLLNAEEMEGTKKVLQAAALTYVAALAASIAQFLRILSVIGVNRRR